MGLETIPSDAARVGFAVADALGALESVVLHTGKTQTYDFDLDKNVESGGKDLPVKGLFYREKEAQASTTDSVFMVKGEDAPDGIDEAD